MGIWEVTETVWDSPNAAPVGTTGLVAERRMIGSLLGVGIAAGLSCLGLIPFAGVGFSSLADAIGMRHAILLGGVAFGVAAMSILLGPSRRACFPVREPLESRSGTAPAEPLA